MENTQNLAYYLIRSILHETLGKSICLLCTQDHVLKKISQMCTWQTISHTKNECNAMNKKSCKLRLFYPNVAQTARIMKLYQKKNSDLENLPKWFKPQGMTASIQTVHSAFLWVRWLVWTAGQQSSVSWREGRGPRGMDGTEASKAALFLVPLVSLQCPHGAQG